MSPKDDLATTVEARDSFLSAAMNLNVDMSDAGTRKKIRKRQLTKQQYQRDKRKQAKLQQLLQVLPNREKAIPQDYLFMIKIYFSGSPNLQNVDIKQCPLQESHAVFSATHELECHDTTEGCRVVDFDGNVVATLVPRHTIVSRTTRKIDKVLSTLDKCHDVMTASDDSRGPFCCGGRHLICGGVDQHGTEQPSVLHASLQQRLDLEEENLLCTLLRVAEQGANVGLDHATLSSLYEEIDAGERQGIKIPSNGPRKPSIWSVMAGGRNLFSHVHFEEEFSIGVFSPHVKRSNDESYKMGDSICNYFNFPTLGVALALRPGDQLLFRSSVPHCVSSRVDCQVEVFNCSCYAKPPIVRKRYKHLKGDEAQGFVLNAGN